MRGREVSKNILLVTGDHTRHDALACNLDARQSCSLAQVVKTPSFDRLASEGVTFRNSFTPNPICVPGRASITTGNYSHKCTGSKSNGGRIRDDQPKLAEHFAQAGYATYAIGKLHYVPYSPPGEPRLLHGFEVAELMGSGTTTCIPRRPRCRPSITKKLGWPNAASRVSKSTWRSGPASRS